MRKLSLILSGIFICLPVPALAQFGPISKWEKHKMDDMDAEFTSSRGIYDIERCVLDLDSMPGIPFVYRQPDRPNFTRMLWHNDDNSTSARLDLEATESGTKVKSWKVKTKNPRGFGICIPR